EFIIGNVAGLLYIKYLGKDSYKKNYDAFIFLCGIVLVAMLHFEFANYHSGLLAVVFIPFILLLSLNTGFISRIFSLPVCKLAGEISYGIYILQIPVYQLCKFLFLKLNINTEKYSLFYIALGVLLCCAYLSYVYIETPLRKYLSAKKNEDTFELPVGRKQVV